MGNLQCQARLAYATGSSDRDETDIWSVQEPAQCHYLVFAPDE
jgi:hypothetical protein